MKTLCALHHMMETGNSTAAAQKVRPITKQISSQPKKLRLVWAKGKIHDVCYKVLLVLLWGWFLITYANMVKLT